MNSKALKRFAAIWIALLAALMSHPVSAEMAGLTDAELDTITGSGFSSFTLTNDGFGSEIARMQFDGIKALTYTEIEEVRLGYWDAGSGDDWDQNWSGVKIGSESADMSLEGFFFEAKFSENTLDDTNPNFRELQAVTIGFSDVAGTLYADSFTRLSNLNGGSHRASPGGPTTYTIPAAGTNPFYLKIELQGSEKGIWVYF